MQVVYSSVKVSDSPSALGIIFFGDFRDIQYLNSGINEKQKGGYTSEPHSGVIRVA